MHNARLDEAQAEIEIGRSINNHRYADDTTLMADSEEQLKSLHKSERGEWKNWLKTQYSKTKIMASCPITSWQINGETVETVTDFILGGSKIAADGTCSHEIKRCLLLGRNAMTNLAQFSSVPQSCLTLCNPMDCSMPGIPVHHQFPESTQTHVHWVMPSNHLILGHPLLLPP